uniref:Ribosomal protein S12 n=1 Tax=Uronema marinum TaxID=35107 RepID=A0A345WJU8_UROMR|nr:ribosomal protein S12 [Uronema marinum]AXJ93341.1 ribosomal protein S12 [Uronema marinum]
MNKYFIKKVSKILAGNPQKKGMVLKTRIVTPKKPNSARRPVAKIFLVNKKQTVAHIPGIGHNLRKHSNVLIRGGGARDLPGVSYTCIRGVYDLNSVLNKNTRRSIYGVSIPENKKLKLRRKFRQG